jgi:hypothetical protein
MPLTLAQSRVLARHAESGVRPDDIRFIGRINEAAMRLHAEGDFIGTVARYGVTVSDGIFTTPEPLESIRRVSILQDDMPHSMEGTLLSDDVQAFVMNSHGVVPIQQLEPRKFKILGASPVAVEVLGKKAYKYASLENDTLAIDDLYALKLMLIAAFREENNDVEQGIALQEKAIGYMTSKTQKAIANARALQYGNMAVNEKTNTVGWARAKLALAITKGVHMDDLILIDLLNAAESRLLTLTKPWVSAFFKVKGGVLSLPYSFESLLKISVDGLPLDIRSQWFEYDVNGYGYRENDKSNTLSGAIYRGEFPTINDLSEPTVLLVSNSTTENEVSLTIKGKSANGDLIEETIKAHGTPYTFNTFLSFKEITSISKEPSAGSFEIKTSGGTLVAYLDKGDLTSVYSRYIIPEMHVSQEALVRVVARPRFKQKHNDSDELQVKNIDAIIQMAQCIITERESLTSADIEGSIALSKTMERSAVTLQDQHLLAKESGHQKKMNIPSALGLGSIPRIR